MDKNNNKIYGKLDRMFILDHFFGFYYRRISLSLSGEVGVGMIIITLPIGMLFGLIVNVIILGPLCLLFNINRNISELNNKNDIN